MQWLVFAYLLEGSSCFLFSSLIGYCEVEKRGFGKFSSGAVELFWIKKSTLTTFQKTIGINSVLWSLLLRLVSQVLHARASYRIWDWVTSDTAELGQLRGIAAIEPASR